MADSYAVAATAIKAIIEAEFAPEGFTALHDKLHAGLGTEYVAIGISPIRQLPQPGQRNVLETYLFVQFYDIYVKDVDPEQQVNPFRITGFADRLMRAIERAQASAPGSSAVWYFDVDSITYTDDPTGNKSRFEAVIRARGDNASMIERL